ncbi:MAG: hypothetical protein US50_C0004G0002 [Candidatus Nomurabacteria bacterium GW2011_GWB1_37_5]|uniref:Uncharacterized protein n=1 Tax=Candidatus Nomurabacteria bacterium GW2011_GWB1_37_5 TaxID=1618742 RepID=A0A0G0GXV9_9BACT|nr:MAG: hypothetical protein US50_C0004G0002 [Candidatus Nomurabacteria bacterium GW2011_GWB1_37_5]
MATKPTSLDQFGSFITSLLTLLMALITGKSKKIAEIDGDKVQELIDREDKQSIINELIKFINNGWKMTYLIAARVLDLDAPAKMPFSGATLKERSGMSGRIVLDLQKIKVIHKLQEGESYITGYEFKKRLIDDKETLFNSNLIDSLVAGQDEPDMKAFLDQHRGKVLVDFGDTFSDSHGRLYVRCAIVDDERWVSDCHWLDYDFHGHSLALVSANNTK